MNFDPGIRNTSHSNAAALKGVGQIRGFNPDSGGSNGGEHYSPGPGHQHEVREEQSEEAPPPPKRRAAATAAKGQGKGHLPDSHLMGPQQRKVGFIRISRPLSVALVFNAMMK